MNIPPKPKSCCVYPCDNRALVPLRAKPPAPKDNPLNIYWFCEHCAPPYERMGYAGLEQQSLGV